MSTLFPPPRLRDLPPPPRGRTGWPWDVEAMPAPPLFDGPSPAITVVTPSFNQAQYVEATLRSVLLQGYPRLEYRVLDGGSTDGTREVIERYAPWLSAWSSRKDSGPAEAINRGFSTATGDIVAWLNSDDRYLPGTLHAVAWAIRSSPNAAAWIGSCRSVDTSGGLLRMIAPHGLTLPDLADWWGAGGFAQPASFFSRAAAARAGPLDERLQSSFDVDFFLRLARQGAFAGNPDPWAEETVHPEARTSAAPGRSYAELRLVQIRNGFEDVALRHLTAELQELDAYRRMRFVDWLHRALLTTWRRRRWDPGAARR